MDFEGEHLHANERVVVSPAAGVFYPADQVPRRLTRGTTVGFIRTSDADIRVISPFDAELMVLVVEAGERLIAHQRVAWLRAA
jgi:[acyl-carrier-protein] S-malonyltransferase